MLCFVLIQNSHVVFCPNTKFACCVLSWDITFFWTFQVFGSCHIIGVLLGRNDNDKVQNGISGPLVYRVRFTFWSLVYRVRFTFCSLVYRVRFTFWFFFWKRLDLFWQKVQLTNKCLCPLLSATGLTLKYYSSSSMHVNCIRKEEVFYQQTQTEFLQTSRCAMLSKFHMCGRSRVRLTFWVNYCFKNILQHRGLDF